MTLRQAFFPLGVALLAASPWLPLQAQSLYQQRLQVSSGLERDSNPGVNTPAKGGVTRWRVSPEYSLLRRDGQDDLTLKLGATLEQSSNTALSRDRRDGNVQGEWQHTAENTIYQLRGGFSQAALRNVLLQETGQLSNDGTRTTRSLEGLVVHQLSELYTVSGGATAQWNRYSGNTAPNGRQFSINGELGRALAPGRDVYLAGAISRFAADSLASSVPGGPVQPANNSTLANLSVGTRYAAPDDPWFWDARVGAARYRSSLSAGTSTSATVVAQAGYKAPRWSLSLSLARQPVPDALRGTFSPNQQARVSAEYLLTEFTRVALDASWNRTKGLQTDTTRELGLRVSSELSQLWTLSLQLRRVNAAHDAIAVPTRGGATIAGVVLTYTHPDF